MEKAIYESDSKKKSQAGRITSPTVFRPMDTNEKSETSERPKKGSK